jgi:protein ImuA
MLAISRAAAPATAVSGVMAAARATAACGAPPAHRGPILPGPILPGPILLVRGPGAPAWVPCAAGLIALGIDPARLVLVSAADGLGVLRAGLEGARCPGLAAVVLAAPGPLPEYTLTASRQLVLAAEASRVAVIVLRGDAAPRPSAAHTRWHVRAAPSTPLAANAPGPPVLAAELLRRRGGPADGPWHLEWNDIDATFTDIAAAAGPDIRGPGDTGPGDTGPGDTGPGDTGPGIWPPLSGAVVPLAPVRAGAARSRAA